MERTEDGDFREGYRGSYWIDCAKFESFEKYEILLNKIKTARRFGGLFFIVLPEEIEPPTAVPNC